MSRHDLALYGFQPVGFTEGRLRFRRSSEPERPLSTVDLVQFARGLAVDGKTVARYLDLMADLLLVRRLPPLHANVRKRLVKSPKVYVRDSGIVHGLLGLDNTEAVLGHPVAGGSWEGFVVKTFLA